MLYTFEPIKPFNLQTGHLKMGQTNPSGEEINVTNLYLTRNGKPFLPTMGEIHIARTRREDWLDRILKMKAAGINIISSYLFWLCHEPDEGKFNFAGENDIAEFIRLCKENGLYFSLRIGPQITAECRNGGFPDWLVQKNIPLRENNEQYLFYVRRWYQKILEQVRPYLFQNGGNIIIIQLENELTRRPEHLLKLKQTAVELGLTAPIFTATGWNLIGGALLPKDELLPMWGGYAAKPWTRHIRKIALSGHYVFSHTRNSAEIGNDLIQTDDREVHLPRDRYPYTYCELGTGVPNSKHRRPVITEQDNYTMAIVKLGSGCNLPGYYMFCGGKNRLPERHTLNACDYANPSANNYAIVNYDFQAPVGEYGNIKPTYRLLKLLNYFCEDYGTEFAEMQPFMQPEIPNYEDTESLRYAVRTKNNSGYIFVNTYAHLLQLNSVNNVQFKLPGLAPVPETALNIPANVSFFFPFNLPYGSLIANSIMAQPILKYGNTFFFLAIPGISPEFSFKGQAPITATVGPQNGFELNGQRFITLSLEQAKGLYRLNGRVLLSPNADLIEKNGKIIPCGCKKCSYFAFENGSFKEYTAGQNLPLATVAVDSCSGDGINKKYFYELEKSLNEQKNRYDIVKREMQYYKLTVTGEDGWLYVDYYGDSAQIYVNGELFDDHFYNGVPWILPAKALSGQSVVLVIAASRNDFYTEHPPKVPCSLNNIAVRSQ